MNIITRPSHEAALTVGPEPTITTEQAGNNPLPANRHINRLHRTFHLPPDYLLDNG